MRVCLCRCLYLCAGVSSVVNGAAPEISRARQLMRDLPVRFEPNRGQWNPRVKFSARAGGSRLVLTAREAVLSVGGHEVALSLPHSNPPARIEGLDPLGARASYFVGSDASRWRTGVEQYSRVRYAQVYPGVDLIYYGAQNRLEY